MLGPRLVGRLRRLAVRPRRLDQRLIPIACSAGASCPSVCSAGANMISAFWNASIDRSRSSPLEVPAPHQVGVLVRGGRPRRSPRAMPPCWVWPPGAAGRLHGTCHLPSGRRGRRAPRPHGRRRAVMAASAPAAIALECAAGAHPRRRITSRMPVSSRCGCGREHRRSRSPGTPHPERGRAWSSGAGPTATSAPAAPSAHQVQRRLVGGAAADDHRRGSSAINCFRLSGSTTVGRARPRRRCPG